MTGRQADQLIKSGQIQNFISTHTGETFSGKIIRRDRWNLYIYLPKWERTGKFDRGDIQTN